MADKIEIAKFDLDIEALEKASDGVIKSIEKIKKAQADLIKSGKATDKAFAENVVSLKSLENQYKALVSVMDSFAAANSDMNTTTATSITIIRNDANALGEMAAAVQNANSSVSAQTEVIQNNNEALNEGAQAFNDMGDAVADTGNEMVELVKPAAQLLAAINEIKEEQNQLAKAGQKTSEEYAMNAIAIRTLQKEYNAMLKEVEQNIAKQERLATVESRAATALDMQVNSVADAREQNKLLLAARNDVNVNSEEGQALAQKLNAQIDANTQFIKENVSEMEKQKMGIGDYANAIKSALGDMDLFGGQLDKFKGIFESFSPILTDLKDEFKGAIDQFKNLGTAQKAATAATEANTAAVTASTVASETAAAASAANTVATEAAAAASIENTTAVTTNTVAEEANTAATIANTASMEASATAAAMDAINKEIDIATTETLTGSTVKMTAAQKGATIATNLTSASMKLLKVALIGTGIGAIVVLLGSLIAYLSSSEAASNKLGVVLGKLGGIVSKLLKYLEPLGEFVLDVLIKAFDELGAIATKTIEGIANGLEMLGFDSAAKGLKEFNAEMEKAAKNAEHLTKLEQNLTEAQRRQGIMQLKYQQDAEKLRQIRDNENASMAQRIKANEDLGALLKEQLAVEQRIAAQALEVANLRIAQEGATAKNLDAQAEAMKSMLDISERITGQESEQLTNRVSLQKEAADKAREAAEKRAQQMQNELELLKLQGDGRAKSLQQQLDAEQNFADKQIKILQYQLKKRLISQTEYNIAVLQLNNDLRERQAEIAQANLDYELSRIEEGSELELAALKAKGLARITEERRIAKEIADARAMYEKQRFEKGLIDEETYRDNAIKIQHQAQLKEIELQQQTDDLLKERSMQNLEFKQERERLALEARFANEWEIREQQIAQTRERDLAEARQQYTDKVMLDQAILNIEQQSRVATAQMEKEKNAAIWQSRADLAGALSQLLGEETAIGKAAGITQATISTYVGAAKALELGWPLGIIGAATIIANGLATVGKISGITGGSTSIEVPSLNTEMAPVAQEVIPLNAVAPFATGGKVMEGVRINRSNGDNRLITAKDGEVVLTEAHQRMLGGDATFKALGIKGFATGGIVGGSSMPIVQNSILTNNDDAIAKAIGDAVRQGSQQGSQAGTRQGVYEAQTSQVIARLSEN